MASIEGLLPVEFVSRSLYTHSCMIRVMFYRTRKEAKSERCVEWACDPYLVETRAGFCGSTLEDLHIVNEKVASSLDLSRIGTIFPARAKSRVDETVSPDRVKTRRLWVHAGHLSAGDEANGRKRSSQ